MLWLRNKKKIKMQYTLMVSGSLKLAISVYKGLKDNKTGQQHLKQTQPHR